MSKPNHLAALVLILLGLATVPGRAQDWNTARLSVLSGGSIDFNFNSFQKYENGISVIGGTILGITIADEPAGSTLASWDLDFQSFNAQATLTGDAGNTLDLDVIEVTATNNLGLGAATFFGPLPLTIAAQTLVTTADPTLLNTDFSTHQVSITYDVGTNVGNNLLESAADFYTVEIEFTLEPGF